MGLTERVGVKENSSLSMERTMAIPEILHKILLVSALFWRIQSRKVPVESFRSHSDSEDLLEQASRGCSTARQELLGRHRERLLRMVKLRLDRRILGRVDASDVVQEALTEAWQELSDYFEKRPVPFYAWLRRIAWERLVKVHRLHLEAKKRSIRREAVLDLPDRSSMQLAALLVQSGTSPSGKLMRKELHRRVREALDDLPERYREILVLLYLEQLSRSETAAVLEISEPAADMRHLRAIKRIRRLLDGESGVEVR